MMPKLGHTSRIRCADCNHPLMFHDSAGCRVQKYETFLDKQRPRKFIGPCPCHKFVSPYDPVLSSSVEISTPKLPAKPKTWG